MLGSRKLILAGVVTVAVGAIGFVLLGGRAAQSPLQSLASVANPATSEVAPDSRSAARLTPEQVLVNAHWALASADAAQYEAEAVAAAETGSDSGSEPRRVEWSLTTDSERRPPFPLGSQVREFSVVAVDAKPAYLPTVGDQVVIPMLDGKEVTVDVKDSKVMENGDYSWSGHLQGYGTDYPVVMTYGSSSTFATITTPEGAYSMQAVNGTGWLYKNPSEAELSSPGQDDYLEPPEEGAVEQQQTHAHAGEDMAMNH